jgi:hypothetical protein
MLSFTRNHFGLQQLFAVAFVTILIVMPLSCAFSRPSAVPHSAPTTGSRLHAWSLPNPSSMRSSFPGSPWYCEYNPTHRRTVYDDARENPFAFRSLGDDWPLAMEDAIIGQEQEVEGEVEDGKSRQRRRLNFLRSAVQRLRRNRDS